MSDAPRFPILTFDMGVKPVAIVVDPPYSFEAKFLDGIAKAFGIPAHLLNAPAPRCEVTPKMRRLLRSADRRQRKRGRRLYFKLNGKGASRARLFQEIADGRWARAQKKWTEQLRGMSKAFNDTADALKRMTDAIASAHYKGPGQ